MGCKISVVMASYLGEYDGCAKDRISKFHRAIESFIGQEYPYKELIIVSDGCALTISESRMYNLNTQVFIYGIDKQTVFSGNVRNYGLQKCTGDIVCYLDTDDYFGKNHLNKIAAAFSHHPDYDWIYYNDNIVYHNHPISGEKWIFSERQVNLQSGEIGTSSIAHKKMDDVNWLGCDGYGHDWIFVNKLIGLKKNYFKSIGEYYVCHIPLQADS